jgi:hypothetical protein
MILYSAAPFDPNEEEREEEHEYDDEVDDVLTEVTRNGDEE